MVTKEEMDKLQKEIEDYQNAHPYISEDKTESGCDFSAIKVCSLIIFCGGLIGLAMYSMFQDILIASISFSFFSILVAALFCVGINKKCDFDSSSIDNNIEQKEIVFSNIQNSNPNPQQIKKLSVGDYIEKIKNKKILIKDKTIINKLDEILQKLSKIQSVLNDFKDKEKQVKKVVDYYLPSTVSVIDSYIKLENKELASDDFNELRLEVINTIDTATSAFNEILNQMLQSEILDTLVEAKTLNSVLKSELPMEMQK